MFELHWAGRAEDFSPEVVGDPSTLSPDERDVVGCMMDAVMEVLSKLGLGEVVITGTGDIPRGQSHAPRGFSIAVEVHPDPPLVDNPHLSPEQRELAVASLTPQQRQEYNL
jgi:hypothetical protein